MMAAVEGFYCQQCGATSRATCDCRAAVIARRLGERAEEQVDFMSAWRAAADQAKEYIRKHADERSARKQAEAEIATLRAQLAAVTAERDALLKDNERLGVTLSTFMRRVRELQRLLRYLRPALPVLESMLAIARLDSRKAAEMTREIDAALKEQP